MSDKPEDLPGIKPSKPITDRDFLPIEVRIAPPPRPEMPPPPPDEDAGSPRPNKRLELAEAILGYELNDGPTSARAALARVVGHADPKTLIAVRMNPNDIAELDAAGRATTAVDIIADDDIARGDAVGDFADGYLDARIQTALARARAALLGETI